MQFAEIRPKTIKIFILGDPANSKKKDSEHFQSQVEIAGRSFEIEDVAWVKEGRQAKDNRIARLRPDFERGHFFLPSLCRNDESKLCYVKVENGEVKYVPAINETKLMRQMHRDGQLYRVLRPIQRKDEEGRLYDLPTRFMTEYLNHPGLGSYKGPLDATRRVYDISPRPPVIINEQDLEPPTFDE